MALIVPGLTLKWLCIEPHETKRKAAVGVDRAVAAHRGESGTGGLGLEHILRGRQEW